MEKSKKTATAILYEKHFFAFIDFRKNAHPPLYIGTPINIFFGGKVPSPPTFEPRPLYNILQSIFIDFKTVELCLASLQNTHERLRKNYK